MRDWKGDSNCLKKFDVLVTTECRECYSKQSLLKEIWQQTGEWASYKTSINVDNIDCSLIRAKVRKGALLLLSLTPSLYIKLLDILSKFIVIINIVNIVIINIVNIVRIFAGHKKHNKYPNIKHLFLQ